MVVPRAICAMANTCSATIDASVLSGSVLVNLERTQRAIAKITGSAEDTMRIVIIVLVDFVWADAAVTVERRTAKLTCARHLSAPKNVKFRTQFLFSLPNPAGRFVCSSNFLPDYWVYGTSNS